MFKKLGALLAEASLVLLLALASPAGAFTQANISPGGAFSISSVTFQTFRLNSVPGATTTCEEQFNGRILATVIPIVAGALPIGGIERAFFRCTDGITNITALVAVLPSSWVLTLDPTIGILLGTGGTPTSVLVIAHNVTIHVTRLTFRCLFTGDMGFQIDNAVGGSNTVTLLGGSFTSTPASGDNCPAGLAATAGTASMVLTPPQTMTLS